MGQLDGRGLARQARWVGSAETKNKNTASKIVDQNHAIPVKTRLATRNVYIRCWPAVCSVSTRRWERRDPGGLRADEVEVQRNPPLKEWIPS